MLLVYMYTSSRPLSRASSRAGSLFLLLAVRVSTLVPDPPPPTLSPSSSLCLPLAPTASHCCSRELSLSLTPLLLSPPHAVQGRGPPPTTAYMLANTRCQPVNFRRLPLASFCISDSDSPKRNIVRPGRHCGSCAPKMAANSISLVSYYELIERSTYLHDSPPLVLLTG